MSEQGVDAALSAANPIDRAAASELPLEQAESELLAAIMTEPKEADPKPRGLTRARQGLSRSHPRRSLSRYLALGGVVTAALVLFFALSTGGGPGVKPAPAFGAALVRFANSSPLVLIGAPGWHVTDVQATPTSDEREVTFAQGTTPAASLNWREGSLDYWIRDRAASAEISTSAPVLGTTARVFVEDGPPDGPGITGATALWEEDGQVFEFAAVAPDIDAFEERLASLEKVDAATWLNALPPDVIKVADHDAVVQEMLKGIPLPPGFDATMVPGSELLATDRYQLGAAVAGAVACTWFRDWDRDRRNGDEKGVRAAIAAMATTKDWPILREMSTTGDFPSILEEFAAAMPSGSWYGRPLIGDVNSAFSCDAPGRPALAQP